MSRVRFALFSVALAAAALPACGLITASVSVPEAFTHNGDLGLSGSICDEQGNPLDDVLVTIKRDYYLWHADSSYSEYDTKIVLANHAFEIPERRAHELDFTFHKIGYADQSISVEQAGIRANYDWVEGNLWPLNTPVQIVLRKSRPGATGLWWLALDVDYTDPGRNPVIDLSRTLALPLPGTRDRATASSQSALLNLPADQAPPAKSLYAVIERQPTRTTGPDHRVDPLDINLPARITYHFSDTSPGVGFIPFKPAAGTSPLDQMTLAPAEGYSPGLTLDYPRLRQLRNESSEFIPDRNEFFYFHANNVYGKGLVTWSCTCNTDNKNPFQLFVALQIQGDGSRRLAAAAP